MSEQRFRVLFRAAAGPRLGFGHLVRCRSLARALGVTPLISLRGTRRTREAARRLGCSLVDDVERLLLKDRRRCIVVVDDPCGEQTQIWVNRARRLGVPVATVHDLGLGYVPADLGIDGSVRPHRAMRDRAGRLQGPAYAMIDPAVVQWRERRGKLREPNRVLIAFGGGNHVLGLAARLADAIVSAHPRARVRIAPGFAAVDRLPTLSAGEWIAAPGDLLEELARSAVALLAGGVTLYEACAVGTPSVAVALTPAQRLTIRAIASAGATVDGGAATGGLSTMRLAAAVRHLLGDARARRRMSAAGQTLVDGRGIFRVADRLKTLALRASANRHAA